MRVLGFLQRWIVGLFWLCFCPALAFGQASVTVAVGLDAAGRVLTWQGGQWKPMPGTLNAISVGADNSIWGVDQAGKVLTWDGTQWKTMPGGLVQVAAGSALNVWGVNAKDEIWNWDGSAWRPIQGGLKQIGVACDRSVWGVNRAGQVWTWDGVRWASVPGTMRKVAPQGKDKVWALDANDYIQLWDGSRWKPVSGKLRDISVGCAGSVWGVDPSGKVLTLEGSTWKVMPGSLAQVAHQSVFVLNLPVPNIPNPASSASAPQGTSAKVPQAAGSSFVIGPVSKSTTSCGVQGTKLCGFKPAAFVHNSLSSCPSGSFMDVGRMSCWSCPAGFVRGAAAVDDERACTRADASATQDFKPATFRAYLCPEGTFVDPIRGGECWKCPPGYNRSAASVEAANACYVPAAEDFSVATRTRTTPWPSDCTIGSFFDLYKGGACYTCPSGFNRTAYAITDAKACARPVAEQQAKAEQVQQAKCGTGEFFDVKIPGQQNTARGGACYTCPSTYARTVYPVDGAKACELPAGVRFASATRTQLLVCDTGEFFDPISSADPNMAAALSVRNPPGALDPVKPVTSGGSCWRCPSGAKRSAFVVYGASACDLNAGIDWHSARYNQPGLFGLQGAEAVALALVRQRSTINAILADMKSGPLGDQLPADYTKRAWDEIATAPQQSAALKLAVFARAAAASSDPAQATPAEIRLRDDTIRHIRLFKAYMAQDALDAYHAWKGNEDWRKGTAKQTILEQGFDIGQVPPDFEDITSRTILTGLGAAGAMDTAIYLGFIRTSLFQQLMPFAQRVPSLGSKTVTFAEGTKSGVSAFSRMMTELGLKGVEGASGVAAGVASFGPQVIITIGVEVLAAAIEQQITIANAEPKLQAALAQARNAPMNLARMMATPAGASEVMGLWSILMAGPAVPNSLADFGMPGALVVSPVPVDLAAFKVAVGP